MSVLKIAGVPVDRIVESVGTPVVVYDEGQIEDRLVAYKGNFTSDKFATDIVYASKAFTCKAMVEKVVEAGVCLDVVSGGEMQIAKESGMPMERVYFHGNNKTAAELELCFDLGCGNIVLDNIDEVKALAEIANRKGQKINALLRVNPLVEAHTHQFIQTAAANSKFGISIEQKEAIIELIQTAQVCEFIDFKGFHSHIGSQIFGSESFEKLVDVLTGFMAEIEKMCGFKAVWMSMGGGFAAKYVEQDEALQVAEIAQKLIKKCEASGWPFEKIMIEPGRSVVAEAGTSIYTVGYQKLADDTRYLFVDGGMGDNIRPALYDAEYNADIANKMGEEKTVEYRVAGKYCESGDVLIKKIKLQKAEQGDLLAMYTTGAYGYSMASNYNAIGKPAVAFVKDGKARLVLRRETAQDMLNLSACEEVRI